MKGAAQGKVGVLVMAHGTPADPSSIDAFYTRIRHGRPPSPAQLSDLVRRYEAVGGTSPLAARTEAQVAGIAAVLEDTEPGRYVVRFGAKHTDPFIEDAAAELARTDVRQVVGVVLAPHRASLGSDEYLERAGKALASSRSAPRFVRVLQWYDTPGFAELMAERVSAALDGLAACSAGARRDSTRRTGTRRDGAWATVLFTAHSLPERVIAAGDPYPDQVQASAAAVASVAGLGARGASWEVAWQSAGRTPEPWIGPDLLGALRRIGAEARDGQTGAAVVVCPIGFVADHLEVLYDLDVEARGVAEAEGLAFARTASLNDDPRLCAVVARAVRTAADGAGKSPAPNGATAPAPPTERAGR